MDDFLRVEDTGIGLSEMEQLFNPFHQGQRFGGGSGLGLYSLAKRIDALRGQYGVQRMRDGHEDSLFWSLVAYCRSAGACHCQHRKCQKRGR